MLLDLKQNIAGYKELASKVNDFFLVSLKGCWNGFLGILGVIGAIICAVISIGIFLTHILNWLVFQPIRLLINPNNRQQLEQRLIKFEQTGDWRS